MAEQKRTLSTFRSAHDRSVVVPAKIRAALEKLAKTKGPEHWEYHMDFAKIAGVSVTDMAAYADQFEDHVVMAPAELGSKRTPKRVWFVTVKAAKAARGE